MKYGASLKKTITIFFSLEMVLHFHHHFIIVYFNPRSRQKIHNHALHKLKLEIEQD